MNTSEINLVLALVIWVFASAVAGSHLREHGWNHFRALLGIFVWVASSLLVVTAAGAMLGADSREAVGLTAAFLRGVLLVLVAAYSWDRWLRHNR